MIPPKLANVLRVLEHGAPADGGHDYFATDVVRLAMDYARETALEEAVAAVRAAAEQQATTRDLVAALRKRKATPMYAREPFPALGEGGTARLIS